MSAPAVPPAPQGGGASSAVAASSPKGDGAADAADGATTVIERAEIVTERAASPPRTAVPGHVPDFFIVGHEKCGTTALYKMLRQHPQVFMPDYKEPRFFSSDLRTVEPKRPGNRPRTLEQYLALFAPAAPGQLVGEASPQYIRSPGAAKRIAELQPQARIIAILREPAGFLCTFHSQAVHSGLETERDLRRAMALEQDRREGRCVPENVSPSWLMYSEHVRYVEQLRRFHAQFPAEQVLVLIYDEYLRENEQTVRAVMRFLGVDAGAPLEPVVTRGGERKAVRFMPLHAISRKLKLAREKPENHGPLARTVARLAPPQAQVLWKHLVYAHPSGPDERLMAELRVRCKPEVQALSDYLGRDLVSLWGYDGI
jgi:Sulfotransferase family